MATKSRIINTKNLTKYLQDFPNSGGTKGFQFGMQIKNLVEYIIDDSDLSFDEISIDELQAILESTVKELEKKKRQVKENNNKKYEKYLK